MMRVRLFLVVAGIMLFFSYAFAEKVPGTGVNLQPPDNFKLSTKFSGFRMEETGASIVVAEIPGPYSQIKEAFTSQNLAQKGITLIEKRDVRLNQHEAILIHASQFSNGIDYIKIMLVSGDDAKTLLLNASCPKQHESSLKAPLEKSLLAAKWSDEKNTDLFEGLIFHVEEKEGLKYESAMLNAILLSSSGNKETRAKNDPFMVVGSSLDNDGSIEDKTVFTRNRLHKTTQITQIEILSENSVRQDGLPGVMITAKGKHVQTNEDRFVFHALLFTTDGYFIFQGFSPLSAKERYATAFESVMKTFKRK